jgi:hypothetical protein
MQPKRLVRFQQKKDGHKRGGVLKVPKPLERWGLSEKSGFGVMIDPSHTTTTKTARQTSTQAKEKSRQQADRPNVASLQWNLLWFIVMTVAAPPRFETRPTATNMKAGTIHRSPCRLPLVLSASVESGNRVGNAGVVDLDAFCSLLLAGRRRRPSFPIHRLTYRDDVRCQSGLGLPDSA